MKETFYSATVRMPGVVQRLDGLHRLLEEQKRGLYHAAPALLWEHLRLLRDKDKVFNDFLPGLGQEVATENSFREILQGLGHRCLTALLQSGHSVYQIGHRCPNGAVTKLAAHRAPAYHWCGQGE